MPNVRKFPAVDQRVETGVIQFGENWPGLFLRGDDAFALSSAIKQLFVKLIDSPEYKSNLSMRLSLSTLKDIADTIDEEVTIHPKRDDT